MPKSAQAGLRPGAPDLNRERGQQRLGATKAMDDYTDHHRKEDIKILHGMGYAQELQRSMSRFSNFAISFSIICILSGGINSFAQATGSIGGAGAGIGWIVGCFV